MGEICKIFGFLDFKKICREYKVGLWECPPFIFSIMGVIIIVAILITYFVGNLYVEPIVVISIVFIMAVILFVLTYIIMISFERIAGSSRDKSEFISIASHQLRNPLSSIKWQLDLLLDKEMSLTNGTGKEALRAIEEQNERMVFLVNDLLEINRYENKALVLSPTSFLLTNLTKEIIARFTERAGLSNVEIHFFPPEENIEIISDKEKLKVVLSHLLDNAIRYSPHGGKIDVIFEKIGQLVRVSVRDEGIGIPEKDKKQIFSKFFRGTTSKKYKSEGLGLGLYVVKIIVEVLGGKVGFSSVEGRGSTFWFALPLEN